MEMNEQHSVEAFSSQLLINIETSNNCDVLSALQHSNLHKRAGNSGWTLLHYASDYGNDTVVLRLIELGAYVDAQTYTGRTPLMLALQSKRLSTVKILLNANADIYVTNLEDCSFLGMVMPESSTDLDIVEMVYERLEKDFKETVEIARVLLNIYCHLHHLIYLNKPLVARYFLDDGYPVDICNSKELSTSLHVAVEEVNLEFVKLFLEYGHGVEETNNYLVTPILCYRTDNNSEDNVEILNLLLSKKPNLLKSDMFGETPMSHILGQGEQNVVFIFLRHGVNMSKKDSNEIAALHYLVQNKRVKDFVEVLHGIEFDVNILDYEGRTPLHLAAFCYNLIAMDFLLKNGADVNARNINNRTPLYFALTTFAFKPDSVTKNRESVELLLQYGADIESAGDETQTVIDLLRFSRNNTLCMPVFMHLAIREALGTLVTEAILNGINSDNNFKQHFQKYRCQIKQMQEFSVYDSVTLLKLLIEDERKILGYLRNPNIVERLVKLSIKCIPESYCFYQLQKRLEKAIRTVQIQQQAAVAIGRITQISSSYNMILDQIVRYLDDEDVENLLNA